MPESLARVILTMVAQKPEAEFDVSPVQGGARRRYSKIVEKSHPFQSNG
jgi:hypothetical protein